MKKVMNKGRIYEMTMNNLGINMLQNQYAENDYVKNEQE